MVLCSARRLLRIDGLPPCAEWILTDFDPKGEYCTRQVTITEQKRRSRKVSEPSPNDNAIVGHIRQPPFDALF
jgi:hypothetical protein